MPTAITHEPIFNTPASSTNTAVVRWSGTTGSTLQDCGVLIDGSNNITGIAGLTATQIDITAQGDLRLQDTTGGQHVALQANGTTTTHTLTFPAAQGSASTVLTNDGAGALTWAAAAVSAISRAGGDSTEATTTSTSAVDLLAASSLTIGATEPFLQMHNGRKTSGAANYTPCGYKMNSTTIGEATGSNVRGWYSSGTNQAEDGGAWAIMGPRVTNYQAFSRGLRSSHISGTNAAGINGTAAHLSQMTTDAVMPIATVTDFVIRGLTLNASNTLGADELQLYSYAAS